MALKDFVDQRLTLRFEPGNLLLKLRDERTRVFESPAGY